MQLRGFGASEINASGLSGVGLWHGVGISAAGFGCGALAEAKGLGSEGLICARRLLQGYCSRVLIYLQRCKC